MAHLRDIRPEDKDRILAWRNSPEVAPYMYTDHLISEEEHDHWFRNVFGDQTQHYWIITSDGLDIGVANITKIDLQNKRCEWAFYLAEAVGRGKGTGTIVEYEVLTYVFDSLKLHKLCCEVLGFNGAVVKMHKKFGFKEEGIFREHILKSGQFQDVVRLGLLDREWAEEKPEIEARLHNLGLL